MRTKNAKRLWLVPATLAVMAVAAFLTFGLMATTGAQPAAAQDFEDNVTASTSKKCEADVVTNIDVLGGGCTTTSDSVDVLFFTTATMAANIRVYVTGGGDYPNVQASSITENRNDDEVTDTNAIGKKGVARHTVRLAEDTFEERREQSITVTTSMADSNGQVYLFAYVAPDADNVDLDADSTALQGTAQLGIRVQFVGAPAFGKDTDDISGIQVGEERSKVTVTSDLRPLNTDSNIDGKEDAEITLTGDADGATINVTVTDAGGQPLDGIVTFDITSVGARISGQRTDDLDVEGTASYTITQLPNDTDDAFRVEVVVVFSNDLHTFDMGKAIVKRTGDSTTIKSGVFSVGCLIDPEEDAGEPNDAATGYADDNFVMKDNEECIGPMDNPRFGVNEEFVVKAHLEDDLMSVTAQASTLSADLDDDVDDPISAVDPTEETLEANAGTKFWVYKVDEDAMLGNHEITISTTVDDVDDVVLNVAVAGPPMSYMLVNPADNIELTKSAMFTVQAYDENMGVPNFSKNEAGEYTDNTVEIVVPDIAENLVRGVDNGKLELDADTGMGTFTIYAPSNAADGSTARIIVGSGDGETTHTVTFGAATPGEGEMVELMMPTGVRVNHFFGLVNVEWTAGQGADGHAVLLFNAADNASVDGDFLNDPTVTDHTFKGVASGDYYVIVAAYQNKDEGGRDYEYDFLGTDVTVR